MSLLPHPILAEYSISHGLLLFLIFGFAGILMTIVGYKLFDKLTPGDLHAEIFEKKNIAAAILAGSVIIGVSLILAAAMSS
jgi:putative membrane protein